jgi:hypothetical protein
MLVSLSSELPSAVKVANPSGADGAVPGMAGPAEQEPTAETMMKPMKEGHYVAVSPGGGTCTLQVERMNAQSSDALSLDPATLPAAGLTEEMLAKFNQPSWRAIIQMQVPAEDVRETVIFATNLAKRLAILSDGIVMDTCAYRFFGPAGWPVENPIAEFDAREHVHVHIETGEGEAGSWFHTHGLTKFGRPEMEIYDVPSDMDEVAFAMLLDTAQYVITSGLIEPGQTCGDPNHPFFAREGTKNREGHWEDVSVLELVDLGDNRKPVSSGAPKALQAFAAVPEADGN